MALKLIVDTLEGIAEPQQALYVKQADGKFKLDVTGLEDTGGLKTALEKERQRAEDNAKALKQFEGIDPEEARKMANLFNNSEESKLLKAALEDPTKLDALRQRWTEGLTKAQEKALKKIQDEHAKAIEAANTKASKWTTRVLDNALREAAEKVGMHAPAIEDWILHARSHFNIDDDGNAVQVDKEGAAVAGSPADYAESLRETKPHWFPASGSGGGAQQSKTTFKGRTMKRSDFDLLDPVAKRAAAVGPERVQIID